MADPQATVRDLRNHGGDVLDRVAAGERVVVTRDGRPVAVLSPLPRPRLGRNVLLERWRTIPNVDHATLRRDLDTLLDAEP